MSVDLRLRNEALILVDNILVIDALVAQLQLFDRPLLDLQRHALHCQGTLHWLDPVEVLLRQYLGARELT